MTDLIIENPEAMAWVTKQISEFSNDPVFNNVVPAILWTSNKCVDGTIIPISAQNLVEKVHTEGLPVLRGHDPGLPQGKVLTAKAFIGKDNTAFVAAVLGLYSPLSQVNFLSLGCEPHPIVT